MTATSYRRWAVQDFDNARRHAFWRGLLSRLTRKCNQLLALDQVWQRRLRKGQRYLGVHAVPLDCIVGSEGRYRDFDRAFFPRQSRTRDRWLNVDQAYYRQVPLPPVDLLKVGDMYFVRDGNHRVSVARVRRQAFVDAHVTELDT